MTLKLSTLPGQLCGGSRGAGRGEADTETGAWAALQWWLSPSGSQPLFSIPLTLTWTVSDANQAPLAECHLSSAPGFQGA